MSDDRSCSPTELLHVQLPGEVAGGQLHAVLADLGKAAQVRNTEVAQHAQELVVGELVEEVHRVSGGGAGTLCALADSDSLWRGRARCAHSSPGSCGRHAITERRKSSAWSMSEPERASHAVAAAQRRRKKQPTPKQI